MSLLPNDRNARMFFFLERNAAHLVCHGSLNPEVQYVYHCTTHVPYNTAYAIPSASHDTCARKVKEPTLTTTANTIGPKIKFTLTSMPLNDPLIVKITRGLSLASERVETETKEGTRGNERNHGDERRRIREIHP
jgi:hypothetical protein